MFDSVRTSLTLWYTGVLALTLIVFSLGVYYLSETNLRQRLDSEVRTTTEGIARLLIYEFHEGESESQAVHSALNEHYFPNQAAAIFDAQGRLLSEKALPDNHRAEFSMGLSVPSETIQLMTVPGKDGDSSKDRNIVRIATQRVTIVGEGKSYVVVVSQSLELLTEELKALRRILLMAVPLALALAGLGGWFMARKSLLPVVAMSESARRIGAENLAQRVPVANPHDELGQLASAFNELLERLQNSFAQQRQFMADASHELRTPLSVIRTAAAVTLEQPMRDELEYREALTMIDRQAARLTRIVDEMFTLARADAGKRELRRRDFYLDELVAETSAAAALLAERNGVAVECIATKETRYCGDEELLRQMILNLLDNAIKFTPSNGRISVELSKNDSCHIITVNDTGLGIPVEARAHIFERFYRVDQARSRLQQINGSGAGLGLSIARWIAESHGGSLELLHSDHAGSTFVVSLPTTG
ncbi:MAG: HAMP domain-containing protein [Acidobacteria bacterium]|nr:HAMP domain-containing protein [Acidobacteriota bacterium]